jgi:multiple sugar transport system ATP-binding protein
VEGTAVYDGETLLVKSPLGEYTFPQQAMKLDEEIPLNADFPCVLGVRPETVELALADTGHKNTVAALVYASQPAGSETLISLHVNGAELLAIQLGLREYEADQKIFAILHPGRMNVYNKTTTRLIKYARATLP